jgi:hypothetical protein
MFICDNVQTISGTVDLKDHSFWRVDAIFIRPPVLNLKTNFEKRNQSNQSTYNMTKGY